MHKNIVLDFSLVALLFYNFTFKRSELQFVAKKNVEDRQQHCILQKTFIVKAIKLNGTNPYRGNCTNFPSALIESHRLCAGLDEEHRQYECWFIHKETEVMKESVEAC